jgi:hypothetical protein
LFVEQTHAERAQAQTGLLREAANAHAEAAVAHEVKLQAEVAAAHEIQCVKEVMARQAQKEATDLKKLLEDAERKAKDAAADLQAVVEGKSSLLPWADSMCFLRVRGPDAPTLNQCRRSRDRGGPQEGVVCGQGPGDDH